MSSVFFGVTCGFGLTLAFGVPYTVVTAVAPFICLGIGIDDMFVISRCFDIVNAEEKQSNLTLTERVGLAMKNAGTSITVTTLTDVFAFGIGGMTYFPGLK